MITLVALPTIWLVNRDGGSSSSRPNVAAVGLDPGNADEITGTGADPAFDPMGTADAAYLEPLSTAEPPHSVAVAVGTAPDELVATARASYRRSVQSDFCLFNGMSTGETITVVNVANGRTISCTTRLDPDAGTMLVMSQSRFEKIAELIAAPIHVEIRQ